MPFSTRYATSASGTGWTNASNANADDAAYATYTIAAKNTTGNLNTLGNFGFDGVLPATATISSVVLEVQHKVSTTASVAHLECAVSLGGAVGTYNTDSTEPTTDTIRSYTLTRPLGGAWTRADLLDGTFTVLLRARSGNSNTSATYSWDYARVTVTYTDNKSASPAAGVLRLVGQAPTLRVLSTNWFVRVTDGANTWAPRESGAAGRVAPSAGTLRVVGQEPLVSSSGAAATIDGGGEINYFVEAFFSGAYEVFGGVSQSFTAYYTVILETSPATGALRFVGQTPTASVSDVGKVAAPSVGTLRFVGAAPAVVNSANLTVAPGSGSLLFVGQAPEAVLGYRIVNPEPGVLRFVGNVPASILPTYAYPQTGTLRFAGNASEITRFVFPVPGVLRIRSFARVGRAFTATYQVFSEYAQQDFLARYLVNGSVSTDFTAAYQVQSAVCSIRFASTARRTVVQARASGLRLTARKRTIRIKTCAS